MSVLPRGDAILALAFDRHRLRAAHRRRQSHGGGLSASSRRALRRARAPGGSTCSDGVNLRRGAQAAGLQRRARAPSLVLGRLRRDRLARSTSRSGSSRSRARAHAARPARRRRCSSSSSRSRTRRARPRSRETGGAATFVRRAFNDLAGFVDRLGALPRLPDRHRARGALPAALPRARARLDALDRARGTRRRRRA